MGLSSRDGIMPLSHSQDIGGPLARTVTDLAIMLDATVGSDPVGSRSRATSEGRIPHNLPLGHRRSRPRGRQHRRRDVALRHRAGRCRSRPASSANAIDNLARARRAGVRGHDSRITTSCMQGTSIDQRGVQVRPAWTSSRRFPKRPDEVARRHHRERQVRSRDRRRDQARRSRRSRGSRRRTKRRSRSATRATTSSSTALRRRTPRSPIPRFGASRPSSDRRRADRTVS